MNQDTKNLNKFVVIFRNLKQIQEQYWELEEFGINSMPDFFDDYGRLNANLESTINVSNLTEKGLERYVSLNREIYKELMRDFPSMYSSIMSDYDEAFSEAYEAAKNVIETFVPDRSKKRFFACGFSFFHLYVPPYNLLGMMLEDGLLMPDHFIYKNDRIELDIAEFNEEYGLTGQEYEIYGEAYAACIKLLNAKLNLHGTVTAYIN